MERLSVRLTDRMFRQLDALALERGVDRTRVVRQLLEAGFVTVRPRRPIRRLRTSCSSFWRRRPGWETWRRSEHCSCARSRRTRAGPPWRCLRTWRHAGSECLAVQSVQGARDGSGSSRARARRHCDSRERGPGGAGAVGRQLRPGLRPAGRDCGGCGCRRVVALDVYVEVDNPGAKGPDLYERRGLGSLASDYSVRPR